MDADDADIVEMASELEYELLEDDVDQPLVSLPPAPSSSDAAPKAQMGKPVQDRGAKQEPSPPSPPNAAEMAAPKKRARTRAHSETSRASASIGSTPATSSAAADGKQSPPPVAEMSSNRMAGIQNKSHPPAPPWQPELDDVDAREPQLEKKVV